MAVNYQYPAYVENPGITATVYQKGEDIQWGDKWATVTRVYIGTDDSILGEAYSKKAGTSYDCGHGLSGIVESCKTQKLDADRTQLQLLVRCPYDKSSLSDEAGSLDTTWACTMSQMEVPLYRYCSPLSSSDPTEWGNAAAIEAWEHEEDPTLKADYSYTNPGTGETESLMGRSLDIAKLMNAGVDARICFYPQATRTTRYAALSDVHNIHSREKKLNYIDKEPLKGELDEFMSVDDYSWLKSGYDVTQNTDGSWTLVETWIGTPEYLGEWNENLYSSSDAKRWDMWKDNQT
jgi:hypothetical protein